MIPRRRIDELLLAAKLDASYRAIIVEGDKDRTLLKRFLTHLKSRSCIVLPVGMIEIPQVLGGNRSRVIKAASLIRESSNGKAQILSIADKDLEIFGESSTAQDQFLKLTASACIEGDIVEPDDLAQFLESYFQLQVNSDQLSSIYEAACKLYCLRKNCMELGIGSNAELRQRHFELIDGNLELCTEAYLSAVLSKHGLFSKKAILRKATETDFGRFRPSAHFAFRGPDLIAAIGAYARMRNKNERICNEDAVRGALFSFAHPHAYEARPLFQEVKSFLD